MAGPVGEAVVYSLSAEGKRLRPALVLAVYRELGGAGDAAELAVAVEVVHTYSLVHDDLPCMDDDDLRRGRPTTHRVFGPATAMEAAFRMVPLSARILASGATRLGLSERRLGSVAGELFRAAGASGMIGGQVLDLEAEGKTPSADTLMTIHRAKTGALIAASVVVGAMAAGASPREIDAIRGYGREIGLAFQIVDDVLDATGSSAELGKTAGKDAKHRKATYPAVLGMKAARTAASSHVTRAVDHLGGVGLDSPLLSTLAEFMLARRS
jgi:geranylgeranyl pyrophosphate synthase